MKQTPRHDFPVTVTSERDERPVEASSIYDAIFEVQLNHTVSFYSLPQLPREPWPPKNDDQPRTQSDACRNLAAVARFLVTPSSTRQGSRETFADEDGEPHTVFYTSEEVYALLEVELKRLADQPRQVHLVSTVADVLRGLILDRIIPSGLLNPYVLKMLGRGERGV